MAKTRAQRKAERRAREARESREGGPGDGGQARAQHDTQVPESGDVAEVEAVLETGAPPEELGESVRDGTDVSRARPGRSRSPQPDDRRARRRSRGAGAVARRRRRTSGGKKSRASSAGSAASARRSSGARRAPRRCGASRRSARGGAAASCCSFLISCWAELKRVQWPDRETLIQASAVTLIFIAVAAAYLGALDAVLQLARQAGPLVPPSAIESWSLKPCSAGTS